MDSLSLSDIINESTEFIPLMTSDEEVEINNTDLPEELPILPLRNTVIFPGVVAPITGVGIRVCVLFVILRKNQNTWV